MQQAQQDIIDARNKMELALSAARDRGQELAAKERAYRISKSQKILMLKAQGYPATLILDLVKGDTDIAEKKFNLDTADVLYRSAQEAINVYKLEFRHYMDEAEAIRRGE
jgi:hypothetical protein